VAEAPPRPVALVTGASSGIGRACARSLAGRGWDLIVLARRGERLQALADDLRAGFGTRVECVSIDLADEPRVRAEVVEAMARFDRLDAAVLAAGHGRGYGALRDAAGTEQLHSEITVDLMAVISLSHLVIEALDRSHGSLVLLGSIFSYRTAPNYSSYCAAKAGLLHFARALRQERGPGREARICVVSPGTVRTEFASQTVHRPPEVYPAELWPFQPLEPEDVAEAVTWAITAPPHVELRELLIQATGEAD